MTRRVKLILAALVVIAVAFFAVGVYGITQQTDAPAAPTEASPLPAFESKPAPAITGTTLDGQPFSLAEYRGTPVVLNFWASWCAPCRRELPAIAAFAKAHPEVQVLGVNYQDGLDAAKAFAAENGVAWPSVVDDGPIGAAYEVPGLPATYLIDAQGRIVERLLGEVTEEQLEERIKVLTA
jgi:DsbE subfamily thiol:disulfide oxidoreductase